APACAPPWRRSCSGSTPTSPRRLAVPADREWMARAACAGASTETFFPQQGENDKVEAAKRVCSGCPVRVECLSYALEHRIVFGVWGGTSEKQRKILRSGRHARPEDVMERVSRYL